MDNRKFQSAASATPPAAEASPSSGYPTDGNPSSAVPATIPGAHWFHQIGEELRKVITDAGLTPSAADLTQLSGAIQQMIINGGPVKAAVRVASTVAINLAAPGASIDGVAMVAGDRFLEKDHGTGSSRGIYVWNGAAVPATRAGDADGAGEIVAGMLVIVQEGTTNADTIWELSTDGAITVGATALTFALAGSSKFVKKAGDTLLGALALFGGDTGVTPAALDNSTKLATTAWAKAMGINFSNFAGISGTIALDATYLGKFIEQAAAGTVTLMAAAGGASPAGSAILLMSRADGVTVQVSNAGTESIRVNGTTVSSFTMNAGDDALLVSGGNGGWALVGTAKLKYLTQFAALLTDNGYRKGPSGDIEQWGKVNLSYTTSWQTTVITLPTAYAVAQYSASALFANSAGVDTFHTVTAMSATQLSIAYRATAPTTASFYYKSNGK